MVRTLEVKFYVLRSGAVWRQLYPPKGSAPSLRCKSSGVIKTSLSGSFVPCPGADWLRDEIQPVLVINGLEHPLGVFLPATLGGTDTPEGKALQLTAYDRCWQVQTSILEEPVYFAAGTAYITALQQLLTAAGIGLVQTTPSALTLPEAREWAPGTSRLTIINELLGEINYKTLHFSAHGAALLVPAAMPGVGSPDHILDNSDVRSLMLPQMSEETDIYKAPNVFLAVCSNPDKSGVMTATAENNNPQSARSIMRRGRRITQLVKVNNIANQDELQAYVDRVRDRSMSSGQTINVETALLPGFGVDDVTALHYDDLAALCIETAWDMQLKVGGTMRHTLERVIYNV